MVKRIFVLALIILMSLCFYCVVFADSNIENDNNTLTITSQDDNQNTTEANQEETREFTTSRRYSLQIGIVLLILIAVYKVYKYTKYRKKK